MADIKSYWKEIAAKAGIDATKLGEVEALLADPVVGKLFEEKFKTLPDYSRDLDATRDKTKKDTEDGFRNWYATNVEKPWATMKTKAEMMDKYKELYGDLDDQNPPNKKPEQTAMTKEELAELLDARLKQRDAATLDLLDIRERHMTTFKKGLPVKDFEKAWMEHPEWGNSMTMAYDKYVEPEIMKIRDSETTQKIEDEVQKRLADLASRKGIPLDNGPKVFSPLFDQKQDLSKLSSQDQERHSREEFFKGFNEPAKA